MNATLFRALLMADPSLVSWETLARSIEPRNDCENVASALTLPLLPARQRFRAFAVLVMRYPLFEARHRYLVVRALRDPHPAVRKLGVAWLLMQPFRGDEWSKREMKRFMAQSSANFWMAASEIIRLLFHVVRLRLARRTPLSQN